MLFFCFFSNVPVQDMTAFVDIEQFAVQHQLGSIIKPHWLYKPSHDTGNQHDGRQPHQLAPGLAAAFDDLKAVNKDGFASAIACICADYTGAALEGKTMVMRIFREAATKAYLVANLDFLYEFYQCGLVGQQMIIREGRLVKCCKRLG